MLQPSADRNGSLAPFLFEFKHGQMNYKDTKPYMSAFLAVDLLTDFAAFCLTDFIDYTVRKMDLILHSIQRRPQMQFSMGRRFMLQLLRRYSVKFCKMLNFTLGPP